MKKLNEIDEIKIDDLFIAADNFEKFNENNIDIIYIDINFNQSSNFTLNSILIK